MKLHGALVILGSIAQFCCAFPTKCEHEKCPPGCEIIKSLSAEVCPECDCTNLNRTVKPKLIFSNEYNIFQMDLDGRNAKLLARNLGSSWGLDFDWIENCIYFSDNGNVSSIKRMCLDTSEHKLIQTGNIHTCQGLAVDWIGRNLYWSDAGKITIEVSTLDGKFRKVLISEGLEKPRAIVVDPFRGYMYWTDWGVRPYIGKAGMDGTGFSKLITESLSWPSALTIDYVTKEIFWADAWKKYIAVADLDGLNRKIIYKNTKGLYLRKLPEIYFLTVFEDQLYWSNWFTKSVERSYKYDCDNYSAIGSTNYKPMAIQVIHPDRQTPLKTVNPCTNAGCKALCLLKPGGDATCSCPENHVLEDDNISCRSNCTISQFMCKSTYKCIPKVLYCEKHKDCENKSHEPVDCPAFLCKAGKFQCANFNCIPPQEICDAYSQCGDMSDEQNCDEYTCLPEYFKCARNGTTQAYCITKHRHCDGTVDCTGGEDEIKCDYSKFIQLPSVCYQLKCNEGCTVDMNAKPCPSCKCNMGTCETWYPCSQHCYNTNGSYTCSCELGYSSINYGMTCKANTSVKPKLIYASQNYIFQSELHGIHIQQLVYNLTNAVALDFDWIENCIYWSDTTKNGSYIKRMCSDTPGHQLLHSGYKDVKGLAVDWIGPNLYWSDIEMGTIEVSALNGRFRKILIGKGLQEPREIALDPLNGYMYWVEWVEKAYIGRAGMDGTGFTKIINASLYRPHALTIDYVTKEIFWADSTSYHITMADLNGFNRKNVMKTKNRPGAVPNIYSLSVFEDRLYWSDIDTMTIERCHKYHCTESETIATTEDQPLTVQVFHPYRKPPLKTENPCKTAGCKVLCLLKPGGGARCACPENYILEDDNVSCRNNCLSTDFVCKSTYKCIPRLWYCDNQDDCGDKSDEPADCRPFLCNRGQFQCNNFNCIPPDQICDGKNQCTDMSDEENCDEYPCLSGQFKCPRNGTTQALCISLLNICDDIKDCIGGEDELNCGVIYSCSPPVCLSGCTVDVDAKPCPICKCNDNSEKKERCKTIKWVGEFQATNLNAENERDCDEDDDDDDDVNEAVGNPKKIICPPVKCSSDRCKINFQAKPCPVCNCNDKGKKHDICKTIKWVSGFQDKNLNTGNEEDCKEDDYIYEYDDDYEYDADYDGSSNCEKPPYEMCSYYRPNLEIPETVKDFKEMCRRKKLWNFFRCLKEYDTMCIDIKSRLVVLKPGELDSVNSMISDICRTDSLLHSAVTQHLTCLKESIENYSPTCDARDRIMKTYYDKQASTGDTNNTNKYLTGRCMYVTYNIACMLTYISQKCGDVVKYAVMDIIHRGYYMRNFCSLETFIGLPKEVEALNMHTNQMKILRETLHTFTWQQ